MGRGNIPFIAFNRGLVDTKSIGRVDIDRTRLSASLMRNWLPKTQGPMTLRPGTQYKGDIHNDTGCQLLEFIASTTDVALVELTSDTGNLSYGKARVWLGDDPHALSLLARPAVTATLSLSDTGWYDISTGGKYGSVTTFGSSDQVPYIFGSDSGSGARIDASGEETTFPGYQKWAATLNANDYSSGEGWIHNSTVPYWWSIYFNTAKAIGKYSIQNFNESFMNDNMPKHWRLLSSNYDTGTYRTDTGKWTLEDERSNITGWSVSETKTYTTAHADTGVVTAKNAWRIQIVELNGDTEGAMGEVQMFTVSSGSSTPHTSVDGGILTMNAAGRGSRAIFEKALVLGAADTGTEHGLLIEVDRGPVTFRIGSSSGNDDLFPNTELGTGFHHLSFNPNGVTTAYLNFESEEFVDRKVAQCRISDTGTVEINTPWKGTSIGGVRYDQSADVLYADCAGIHPYKIERRNDGRSWSVVKFQPEDGPLKLLPSSDARLTPGDYYGNTTLTSDLPFFRQGHVGALFSCYHVANGGGGEWPLSDADAITDTIEVTGVKGDTGKLGANSDTGSDQRGIKWTISGTYKGTVVIERSYDGADIGFAVADSGHVKTGPVEDTGTFTTFTVDTDDNVKTWWRARLSTHDSGVAIVNAHSNGGSTNGVCRVTSYNSPTSVEIEVLRNFSRTQSTDDWAESYWSDYEGYPSAVALHGGRLYHAQGGRIFGSVSDSFESYDLDITTDDGPIVRALGSGPVDNIHYLVSLLRLIIGTAGSEIALRSSSLDEPVTPENSNARAFSTQGSSNLRAVKMDTSAIFIQRSGQRAFLIGFGEGAGGGVYGEYKNLELTFLVPDLLRPGIVDVAVQRQPDTRIHFVLADGTVAILTYEPEEEVLAWSTFDTDTGSDSKVENVAVLPASNEDAVYYVVARTVNGVRKRFLEKWAKEIECEGDTGYHWLMDCAVSYAADTGRDTLLNGVATHLVGESVVAWGDKDTGSTPYVDLSPDVAGVQTEFTVDTGGDITVGSSVSKAVVGLPYTADYRSTKLAYGSDAGTALAQMKRTDKMGFVLLNTHNNALFFGNDTGELDPLPRVNDAGEVVPTHKIFHLHDEHAIPFPGLWDEDSRIFIRAKSPRPATVLALVPTINTEDKI